MTFPSYPSLCYNISTSPDSVLALPSSAWRPKGSKGADPAYRAGPSFLLAVWSRQLFSPLVTSCVLQFEVTCPALDLSLYCWCSLCGPRRVLAGRASEWGLFSGCCLSASASKSLGTGPAIGMLSLCVETKQRVGSGRVGGSAFLCCWGQCGGQETSLP